MSGFVLCVTCAVTDKVFLLNKKKSVFTTILPFHSPSHRVSIFIFQQFIDGFPQWWTPQELLFFCLWKTM